jgi:hypothetical protein
MEWKELIGHTIFVKLSDDTIFTNSKVLTYEEPFLSITDKFGLPVIINVKNIMRVRIEEGENVK